MELDIDDAYAELGLTPRATEAEVKAAWRRLAARWHPDRNGSPDAVQRMQRLNRALEEIRRARLEADEQAAAAEAAQAAAQQAPETEDEDPEDDEAQVPPRTLHLDVPLTLEEAAFGGIHELQGEVTEDCPDCEAAGFTMQSGGCPECEGSGRVQRPAWFGWLASVAECEACGGRGIGRRPCGSCGGSGKAPAREYHYRVRIPAGVRDGDLLHVEGRDGEALELRIELLPHEFFELDADGTVRCEIPVDGFAWAANRWAEVPTPGGLRQMRLDRSHLVYRLKGQGFPSGRGGPRGDCIVKVEPLFPEQLDEAQEALIEQLVASNSGDPDTAPGARFLAWDEVLRVWQKGLPGRPRRDGGA
ncbi:DnaJ C-terminal domain-containing protein [Caldimonas tepidiphila]|uniref:DnaJ C-terminal domain-containing protein n=1 Tax=Caldimonas tepidiphila TaxID=2315841 RepID=UPI001473695E|nr:DnaJ C-terminal domain-containing protein [Caldimonas tepidiphila]